MIALLLAFSTLFTPARTANEPNVLLIGNFTSCPSNDDGSFGELIFPYNVRGKTLWAVHLGPSDEFAIFAGPEATEHEDHNTSANLLFPAYHLSNLPTLRGDRNWNVQRLHVSLSVVRAGGSDPECESFFVRLTQHPVTLAWR